VPEIGPECRAFIAHWQALRAAGELVPLSRDFLDRPNGKLQPYVSFNDLHADGSDVLSLYAAGLVDLWGRDLTGLPMKAFLKPDAVERLGGDLRAVADHPCGAWEVTSFTTSRGRRVTAEIVTLPLAVEKSGTLRLARYHRQVEKLATTERIAGALKALRREWLDVGAGVPDCPPTLAAE
jgi:hypothetical protein